jgi:hypothetical protein
MSLAILTAVYESPEGLTEQEVDGLLHVRLATLAPFRRDQHRLRWGQSDPFRKFVERWKPELVHFHDLSGYSADFPEIARRAGAVTVLTLSDLHFTCPSGQRVDYQGAECARAPGQGCLPCLWKEGPRRETIARLARSKAARLLDFSPVTDVVADWSVLSQRSLNAVDVLLCSERAAADMDRFGLVHPRRMIETFARRGDKADEQEDGEAAPEEAQDLENREGDREAADRMSALYQRLLGREPFPAETKGEEALSSGNET